MPPRRTLTPSLGRGAVIIPLPDELSHLPAVAHLGRGGTRLDAGQLTPVLTCTSSFCPYNLQRPQLRGGRGSIQAQAIRVPMVTFTAENLGRLEKWKEESRPRTSPPSRGDLPDLLCTQGVGHVFHLKTRQGHVLFSQLLSPGVVSPRHHLEVRISSRHVTHRVARRSVCPQLFVGVNRAALDVLTAWPCAYS